MQVKKTFRFNLVFIGISLSAMPVVYAKEVLFNISANILYTVDLNIMKSSNNHNLYYELYDVDFLSASNGKPGVLLHKGEVYSDKTTRVEFEDNYPCLIGADTHKQCEITTSHHFKLYIFGITYVTGPSITANAVTVIDFTNKSDLGFYEEFRKRTSSFADAVDYYALHGTGTMAQQITYSGGYVELTDAISQCAMWTPFDTEEDNHYLLAHKPSDSYKIHRLLGERHKITVNLTNAPRTFSSIRNLHTHPINYTHNFDTHDGLSVGYGVNHSEHCDLAQKAYNKYYNKNYLPLYFDWQDDKKNPKDYN